MKTIRHSVFETNSSSSHSVTVSASGKRRRDTTLVLEDDGSLVVENPPDYKSLGNSPMDKAALLYEVAYMLGNGEVVLDAIREFTGATSVSSNWEPSSYRAGKITQVDLTKSWAEVENDIDDLIADTSRLGENNCYDEDASTKGQAKFIYQTLQDKEKIKDFIFCSSIRFTHEETYDG